MCTNSARWPWRVKDCIAAIQIATNTPAPSGRGMTITVDGWTYG
jgi:hypothetical protein